jgi:hypothetical protein
MEKRGKEEDVFANNLGERRDKGNEIFSCPNHLNIIFHAITIMPLPQSCLIRYCYLTRIKLISHNIIFHYTYFP